MIGENGHKASFGLSRLGLGRTSTWNLKRGRRGGVPGRQIAGWRCQKVVFLFYLVLPQAGSSRDVGSETPACNGGQNAMEQMRFGRWQSQLVVLVLLGFTRRKLGRRRRAGSGDPAYNVEFGRRFPFWFYLALPCLIRRVNQSEWFYLV